MATNGRPQDAWRKAAATGPAAGPRTPAGPAPGKRRWLPAAFAVAVLGGLIVGLFVYLGRDHTPVVLAIPVTKYDQPDWPANPFAEQDARGLTDRFPDAVLAFQSQEKSTVRAKIDDAVKAAGSRRPLVVSVVAFGTVLDGVAYLLPSDARPGYDPSGWLTLDDLLAPLRKSSAPRLLILDVRPVHAPRAVLPTGDVNECLEDELKKLEDAGELPFFVLNANTPREGPAVLTPLKRTAFGLAVGHALGGAADGWGGGVRDKEVTVSEFAAYVKAATHAATVAFGGPAQVPQLHGKGTDFHLAAVPQNGPDPLPALGDPDAYPDELSKAWKAADAAVHGGLDRRCPRLVQPFVRNVVRGEQRWRAGLDANAVAEVFKDKKTTDLDADVKRYPALNSLPLSVARAIGSRTLADHGRPAEALLKPAFDAIRDRETDPAKKNDLIKGEQAKVKGYKPKEGEEKVAFDAVAAYTLDAVLKLEKPTQELVRHLLNTADQYPHKWPLAELLPLEVIAGVHPDHYARWPDGTLKAVVNATVEGERATAGDGRFFPWVKDKLTAADDERRKALVTLCDREALNPALREAPDQLARAGKGYAECANLLDALRAAQAEVEKARAVIDDLGAVPLPVSGPNAGPWETSVARVTDAYLGLSDLLRFPPPGPPPSPDDLRTARDALKAAWDDVRTQIEEGPKAPTVREAERPLHWPWWSGERRQKYRDRLFDLTRAATDRVLAAWPTNPVPVPAAPPRGGSGVPNESLRDLRIGAALFRVASADRESADTLRERAVAVKADAKSFTAVARQLRDLRDLRERAKGPGPTAELDAHRRAEREFADWLEKVRYRGDADAVRKFVFPGGTDPAKRLDDLADECAK